MASVEAYELPLLCGDKFEDDNDSSGIYDRKGKEIEIQRNSILILDILISIFFSIYKKKFFGKTYIGENSTVVAGLIFVLFVRRTSQYFVTILLVLAICSL